MGVYVCAQSCPTLCDPIDSSLPGYTVQARILEWVAISSCRGSSWPMGRTWVSYISCIGRGILYHWVIWEFLIINFPLSLSLSLYIYIYIHKSYWFLFLWRILTNTTILRNSNWLWWTLSSHWRLLRNRVSDHIWVLRKTILEQSAE